MLRELSPRERAVVVLRYYCDQSEQETAAALGMPVGTVKSTCARALTRLRVEATSATRGGSA
jgi:RNA polymerase sigma factor (sigma-70 family)